MNFLSPTPSDAISGNGGRLRISAVTVALAFWSGPAWLAAQEQQSAEVAGIEEVIVTAQKREESLQDIPLSIRAIGQQELERIGALSFEDYARGQAGLGFNSAGRYSRGGVIAVIRGVSQLNPQGPTTAFYLDETPLQPQELERVGLPDPNMFDINRVEILRGPQGDLYGSSAMGGTIRVIPNKPDPEMFEGRVDFKLNSVKGGDEGGEGNAMINIPLGDSAALRLVGTYAKDAGWIDLVGVPSLGTTDAKNVNNVESQVVRAMLRWDVNDRLSITPSVFYQKVDEDRGRFVSYELASADDRFLDRNLGVDEFSENEFTVGNLLIEYDAGWGVFTSSTTVYDLEWENNLATTGIINLVVGPPLESEVLHDIGGEDQFVQEVRFASSLDGPLNFILGAFYREIEHDFFQEGYSQRFLEVFGTNVLFFKEGEVEKLDELAFFGQASWRFSEAWEVSAGLRWFEYERDRLTPTATGVFGFPARVDMIKEDGVSPTFTLNFFPTDDATIYARVANGFRPGFGFRTIFPPPCAPELEALGIDPNSGVGTVESDTLWSYELGAKTAWADNRLVLNAAVYQQNWTDLQTAISLDCGFVLSSNAGKAAVDGFEIETQARPVENINLIFNVGYVDATLDEDAPSIGGFDGDRLPGVSEWQIGAAFEYHFPIADFDSYFRADYTYMSDYFSRFDETVSTPRFRQPPLHLIGLRLGMDWNDWNFAFFVKNLTDEFKLGMCGADSSFRQPQPDFSTCGVKPRTIGINVGRYFR